MVKSSAGAALLNAMLAALLCGCGKQPAPPPKTEEITVRLAAVAAVAGGGEITGTGTVRFKRETALSFNTPGRVADIRVREGDRVRAGQLLAGLDPTGLGAAEASARAEAVRAEADARRLRGLAAKGWVTRPRVESADAAAAAARARVTQTGFDVRFGRIVAPTSGIVLRRHLEPGQMAATGTPVVTIGEEASGYVLRIPLPDADLPRVRLGQSSMVAIPALAAPPMAATVSEIAARGDDRTGTFQVELRLPALRGLRSGLIGNAAIRVPIAGATPIEVPASAIFAARADEGFVYVYAPASRTVRARLVGLGPLGDRAVVVTRGLTAGDRVVVSGVDRLREGVRVRIAS